MITKDLEDQLRGKTATEAKGGKSGTIIGAYVTEAAGLVLAVMVEKNGMGVLETWRVYNADIVIS